jgi:hypothetical protein
VVVVCSRCLTFRVSSCQGSQRHSGGGDRGMEEELEGWGWASGSQRAGGQSRGFVL